ncbi:ABC transporter ATP-binding protein [Rufibacter sp. LB8]|uniref:ABC transporter ATP-binding protein n=1 Tax=Rufibacter sp. LB8 TaxID=2777781 RepID=UPI00178C632A|nr:ABC transporter ATP-binding protein [Rufibacter sp. LB8]
MELVIQNLSKTYANGVQALKNVNLTIPTGMFGLLGPNGAGKSSLMRTIATLQEADSGSIRLGELDVFQEKDEMRKVLGYLPQEFGVYPKVSAEELLDHFAVLKGIHNNKERKETVAALLQQTNLYDVRKKNLGGYSGGMKQRFGIAQALLGNPRIIIVDEPTAGLDPAERNRFHNLLSEIGENIIVILSTHIVDDVSDLCRNMAIINKGEVLVTGEPLQAIEQMQGLIFRKFIKKEELPKYQAEYAVISSRLFAGRTMIHVYADGRPSIDFEQVQPDLEDVYFATIGGVTGKAQMQASEEVIA